MGIKKKCAVLACALSTSLMASSVVKAEDVKGSLSLLYSPHRTFLRAPEYLTPGGYLPEYDNHGKYYGLQGEVNYGRYLMSIDYLTGVSNTISGGGDFINPQTFHPLTQETSESLNLRIGYTVLENGPIGKVTPTLGYYRVWGSPGISPANWYYGLELGVIGRYKVHDKLSLTYKVGYVPDVVVQGYLGQHNIMTGKYLLNYTIGAEVPLVQDFSVIGGYQYLTEINKVVVDGSRTTIKFSGFYMGGKYNF